MATLEEQVGKLPKLRKIGLMEQIWADLSQEIEQYEPPAWHAHELEETERRVEEGVEHFEDWSEAKQRLRKLCHRNGFTGSGSGLKTHAPLGKG